MSLLIKGGVMPLTCEECPCFDEKDDCCNVSGRNVIDYKFYGRPDDCPLVEVSTPHGRLIDADKLLKHKYGISQTARTYINTADTIIEEEVSE